MKNVGPNAGLELKLQRIRHRLPQYKVAAALGIHPAALCALENGRRPVAPDQVVAIVRAIEALSVATSADPGVGCAA